MAKNGFQGFVNEQPAPGSAGDFASANPRTSTLAGEGAFKAAGPSAGPIVGRFAWGDPVTGLATQYFVPEALLGFVHKENQTIIVPFLAFEELQVIEGFPVTLFGRGDFWAQFLAGASIGDKVYANALTGQASADDAGAGTSLLGFTGDISTAGVLDVTVDGTGDLEVGMVVTGPGVPPGTYVVSLGTGTGGVGTYNLNITPAVAIPSATMNAYGLIETPWAVATKVPVDAEFTGEIDANGVLEVTAVASGVVEAGLVLAGDDVAVNTFIRNQISGTPGGVGFYQVNNYVVVASTALTGSAGKLAKISTWQRAG